MDAERREAGNPRWIVPAEHSLVWRTWEDGYVVYDDATGATHHLSQLAGEVLRLLLEHPAGMDARSLSRCAKGDDEPDDALNSALAEVLAELQKIGLTREM